MPQENDKKTTPPAVNFLRKGFLLVFIKIYNVFPRIFRSKKRTFSSTPLVREIEERAVHETDINSHLMTMFAEALEANPRTIVELGTRGGESTFVFQRVASLTGAQMLCVDLNDCAEACPPGTFFVQGDDIAFAKRFKEWCVEKNFPSQIDLLFIDTSHELEHTKAEIDAYFPFLSDTATVIFHDTNMRFVYSRTDGTLGYGYCENIMRGVIQAIEEYLGVSLHEEGDFVDYVKGWLIRHRAVSNGLTVMKKLPVGR